MRVTEDGQRLSITTNQAGKRAIFYTSAPTHPTVPDILDLGPNSCPHYLRLTADEKRLNGSPIPPSNDFTQGDHKFHVACVWRHKLDTAFHTDPAPPHGLAFK